MNYKVQSLIISLIFIPTIAYGEKKLTIKTPESEFVLTSDAPEEIIYNGDRIDLKVIEDQGGWIEKKLDIFQGSSLGLLSIALIGANVFSALTFHQVFFKKKEKAETIKGVISEFNPKYTREEKAQAIFLSIGTLMAGISLISENVNFFVPAYEKYRFRKLISQIVGFFRLPGQDQEKTIYTTLPVRMTYNGGMWYYNSNVKQFGYIAKMSDVYSRFFRVFSDLAKKK